LVLLGLASLRWLPRLERAASGGRCLVLFGLLLCLLAGPALLRLASSAPIPAGLAARQNPVAPLPLTTKMAGLGPLWLVAATGLFYFLTAQHPPAAGVGLMHRPAASRSTWPHQRPK